MPKQRTWAFHNSVSNPLPERRISRILKGMEVHFTPRRKRSSKTCPRRPDAGTDDLVEDAMAGYFDELLEAREMLNSRYDKLKSGAKPPFPVTR